MMRDNQQKFRNRIAFEIFVIVLIVPVLFLLYDYLLPYFQNKMNVEKQTRLLLPKNTRILHLLSNKNDTYLIAFTQSYQNSLYVISLKGTTAKIVQKIPFPWVHSMALSKDEKTLYIANNFMLYAFDSSDFKHLKLRATYKLDENRKTFPFHTYRKEAPGVYYSTVGWTYTVTLSQNDHTLFVAGPKGLYLIDISNPNKMSLIHHLDDQSYYNTRLLDKKHLLATSFEAVSVIDISNLHDPQKVSTLRLHEVAPQYIALSDRKRALIGFGYEPIIAHITIDNRYKLHYVNDLSLSSVKYIQNLFLVDNNSVLLVQLDKLQAYDMSYLLELQKISNLSCSKFMDSSFYNDKTDTLYVGCLDGSIQIFFNKHFVKSSL